MLLPARLGVGVSTHAPTNARVIDRSTHMQRSPPTVLALSRCSWWWWCASAESWNYNLPTLTARAIERRVQNSVISLLACLLMLLFIQIHAPAPTDYIRFAVLEVFVGQFKLAGGGGEQVEAVATAVVSVGALVRRAGRGVKGDRAFLRA